MRWAEAASATLLSLALVGLFGCPRSTGDQSTLQLPLVTSTDPEAEAAIRSARQAFDAGDADRAEEGYRAFLREHPQDPLVPIAHLGLGQVLLASERTEQAREHFAAVADHEDPAIAERGRFYDGVALHLLGDHSGALAALRPFVGRTVDPSETALLLETIAAASDDEGDLVGAIEALDALVRSPASDEVEADVRARIEQLVRDAETEDILRASELLPHEGTAWPLVARRAMTDSYAAGDMERVRRLAEALRAADVSLDEELSAMALRAERGHEADPRVVGAILPLSGRGREVGQLALKGLMLAAGTPATGPAAPDAMQIVFRDDAGDPVQAAQAVEDLVSLHRVIAIIGPLAGPTAQAAATRAQELGVPLIALSPTAGVADAGAMVFQHFVTPGAETRELVAAAMARGARRFAAFYPDSPYGNAMRGAFEQSVRSQGGEVAAARSYSPDATSFGREVGELRSEPFDALFVPDSSRRLALIAPALAAAGLWSVGPTGTSPRDARAVTLLVPSVGFHHQIARSSGRYLQGALFSAPFDASTSSGAARRFADAYSARFGVAPNAYAAFAYDSLELITRAVDAGAISRADVATRLSGMRGVETAGPSRGFSTDRRPVRGTRLLTLDGNLFVPVDVPPPNPTRSPGSS